MAQDVKISVKDEASARQWLGEIYLINEDYHQAMDEAGQALTDASTFADGTLVDELTDTGTKILNASKATFEAINAIGDTVTKFIDGTKDFISTASKIVKGVAGLFG